MELPPERSNNSRGRRKYRETAARAGRDGSLPELRQFGRMRLGSAPRFSEWEVAFVRGGGVGSSGSGVGYLPSGGATVRTELVVLDLAGSCSWAWGEKEERILHG